MYIDLRFTKNYVLELFWSHTVSMNRYLWKDHKTYLNPFFPRIIFLDLTLPFVLYYKYYFRTHLVFAVELLVVFCQTDFPGLACSILKSLDNDQVGQPKLSGSFLNTFKFLKVMYILFPVVHCYNIYIEHISEFQLIVYMKYTDLPFFSSWHRL